MLQTRTVWTVNLADTEGHTMIRNLVRTFALGALLATPLVGSAQDYTVQVNSRLNDLAIRIEPVSTETLLILRLTNADDTRVRCIVEYVAHPQMPSRQSLTLRPGRTEQSTFRIRRHLFAITANVQCAPEEWGSMEPPTKPAETAPAQPQSGADEVGA